MSNNFFKEIKRALKTQDLQTEQAQENSIDVLLEGKVICSINSSGSINYPAELAEDKQIQEIIQELRQDVYYIKEYTAIVEKSPFVNSTSGNSDFKLLTDFGGIILAGKESEGIGYQFATWEKDASGNGYTYGHYFGNAYSAAKEDFALRSNLINCEKVFSEQEMALLHKCMKSAMEDETALSFTEEKIAEELCEQIENLCPTIKEQEQVIATPNMEQTM